MKLPTSGQAEVLTAIRDGKLSYDSHRRIPHGGVWRIGDKTVNYRTVARVKLNGWATVPGPTMLTEAGAAALAEYDKRLLSRTISFAVAMSNRRLREGK